MVLTVTVSDGTVTIGDVYNGTTKLTKTTHYTETGGKVTLLKEYLDDLEEDDYTITIETSQGNVNAVITVVDTTDLYDAREGFITADGKRFTTSDDKGFFVVGVGESSPLKIDFNSMTKKEIINLLEEKDIEFDSKAKKDKLIELLQGGD